MGLELEFTGGEGPAVGQPIRAAGRRGPAARVGRASNSSGFVIEAVRKTRAGLAEQLPLIGFRRGARSPWRPMPSKGAPAATTALTKTLMYSGSRRLGRPAGPAGPGRRALSQCPDRRRRAGGAAVR